MRTQLEAAGWIDAVVLKTRVDALETALQALLDCIETPPDANCSCHIAPPCSDCVEHAALREALDLARTAMRIES